jgi:O-antigen/teichoic acid export membrane protein
MLLSGYSNILIEFGDRYLLNILASVSSVGLYSFGYKISRVINMLLVVPIKQSVSPIVYQKEKNPQEQKQLISSIATYFYLIGIFMALGLSLLAKEVIILLASRREFWSAWIIVPIITFSYVQLGLGSFLHWGMILKNKSQYVSGMVLVGALVNIGLNLIFIPRWGILGAAFATLISYVVLNGLYAYYSAKFYDLHFELGRLGYITLVGIGFYLGVLFLADVGSLPLNILIKVLILPIYPLFFLVTGFLTPQEKSYLRKLWRKGLDLYPRRKELPV